MTVHYLNMYIKDNLFTCLSASYHTEEVAIYYYHGFSLLFKQLFLEKFSEVPCLYTYLPMKVDQISVSILQTKIPSVLFQIEEMHNEQTPLALLLVHQELQLLPNPNKWEMHWIDRSRICELWYVIMYANKCEKRNICELWYVCKKMWDGILHQSTIEAQ